MPLPESALSFTIPSIHDDVTTLECRVYHPQSLTPSPHAPPWRRHAAVVAHPYAPLGGSYDDPVVDTVATVLLRQGFVVGTFNFRGAGGSAGRTSWTSRAERGDYMSFAAFVYYYVNYLDPFRPHPVEQKQQQQNPLSPPTSPASPNAAARAFGTTAATLTTTPPGGGGGAPVLLLCGYSYGAMITKLLPPLDAILEPFTAPRTASAAADIRLRAQHLAEKQNLILASARAALAETPLSPRKAALGMRVGGDEDRRRSQEQHGRRSFSLDAEDKIRKGVVELMQRAKSHQSHHHHHHLRKKKAELKDPDSDTPAVKNGDGDGAAAATEAEEKGPDTLPPVAHLLMPQVAYLMVSPPLGWATSLMTLNLYGSGGLFGRRAKSPKGKGKDKDKHHHTSRDKDKDGGDDTTAGGTHLSGREGDVERQKLVDNPTLAIYGDADVFVAARRFREWASRLQGAPGSRFRAHEISTAGHFYVEEGTMQKLADAVRVFSGELLAAPASASTSA